MLIVKRKLFQEYSYNKAQKHTNKHIFNFKDLSVAICPYSKLVRIQNKIYEIEGYSLRQEKCMNLWHDTWYDQGEKIGHHDRCR